MFLTTSASQIPCLCWGFFVFILQYFCFIRQWTYSGKPTGKMEGEAECKLGKKTSPRQTQWNFLPLLSFVAVLSAVCVLLSDSTQTLGGINLGKEQSNSGLLVSYFSF